MVLKNKRGFQISFSWFFAIVVGGSILFLAIYGATKVIDTGGETTSAKAGKEIGVLLNPLESGFESGQVTKISMPVETRIYNLCDDITGNFGKQLIRASQKSFGRWSQTDIDVGFQNKYIFSNETVEGKNFLIFSKPLELPFKVADLIYLTSSKESYCFDKAPEDIKKELEDLAQSNIQTESCSQESVKVCFSPGNDCDINVNLVRGEVKKDGEILYFDGHALMYGAIFADSEGYECQVKRLMKRAVELSTIYIEKSNIVAAEGCSQDINLFSLRSIAESMRTSEGLSEIAREANRVDKENERAGCMLW